jgi:regulatory protein
MDANELKSRALRLLTVREHSREELRRKLAGNAEDETIVEALLDRLGETGLLSDERFAEAYVRAKASRMGDMRLRRELAQRGVADEVVSAALDSVLISDDLERARGVWEKKFGRLPEDRNEWAKQARFMQSRGFSVDLIRKLLKESFDESAQG